jgi:hypothetical protein
MNILDPIFYRTLFYNFRPVISPSALHNINNQGNTQDNGWLG